LALTKRQSPILVIERTRRRFVEEPAHSEAYPKADGRLLA
jgi:hypothetical protein